MFGLSDCLSVIIKACGTHLDFRHKCDGGKTAVMAAELNQHQACVDILNRAAQGSPDMLFQQPSSSASLQQAQTAAGSHLASFPLSQQLLQLNVSRARQQQQQQQLQQLQQQQQLQLQQQQQHLLQHQQQQQEASGVMPGLYPLLSNMQGHTDAMLQLTMQAASLYPFQRLTPVLSAPALSRPGPGGVPPAPSRPGPSLDATPFSAASQRTSTESAYTTGRPSLDDASMLSRIYPSSSLDSSVSQHRMSIEDSNRRLSLSSRPSSVSCHTASQGS